MKNHANLWSGPSCCNTPELRELLQNFSVVKKLSPGENFLMPGTPIRYASYIAEGVTAHTTTSESGREKVLYRLGRGWFFSEEVLLRDYTVESARYAIAETPTTLWLLDKPAYLELLKHPIFVSAIIRCTAYKCSMLRTEIESLTFDSTKERLMRLLSSGADRASVEDQYWYNMKVSWTHQDLAAIIGTNRVTISRLIAELRADGCLRTVNGRLQVNISKAIQENDPLCNR